jgi:hypothetical protein
MIITQLTHGSYKTISYCRKGGIPRETVAVVIIYLSRLDGLYCELNGEEMLYRKIDFCLEIKEAIQV